MKHAHTLNAFALAALTLSGIAGAIVDPHFKTIV
jgi:hypothetical protein